MRIKLVKNANKQHSDLISGFNFTINLIIFLIIQNFSAFTNLYLFKEYSRSKLETREELWHKKLDGNPRDWYPGNSGTFKSHVSARFAHSRFHKDDGISGRGAYSSHLAHTRTNGDREIASRGVFQLPLTPACRRTNGRRLRRGTSITIRLVPEMRTHESRHSSRPTSRDEILYARGDDDARHRATARGLTHPVRGERGLRRSLIESNWPGRRARVPPTLQPGNSVADWRRFAHTSSSPSPSSSSSSSSTTTANVPPLVRRAAPVCARRSSAVSRCARLLRHVLAVACFR